MAFMYDHELAGVAGFIKRTGIKGLMMGRAKENDKLPPMGEENHQQLKKLLGHEVAWAEEFLGRDLSQLWTMDAPHG